MIILPPELTLPWSEGLQIVHEAVGIPQDSRGRSKAAAICTAINEHVWRRKYAYTHAAFNVKVTQGRFWAPPGYGPMRAILVDGQPTPIKHKHFEFHLNGPGTSSMEAVLPREVSKQPAMIDPAWPWFLVGVVSEQDEDGQTALRVFGYDAADKLVRSNTTVCEGYGTERQQVQKTIDGRAWRLSYGEDIDDHIMWSRITNITKLPTRGPVAVVAYPEGDITAGFRVAELQSYDTQSVYTQYELTARSCGVDQCVRGLFRPNIPKGESPYLWIGSARLIRSIARVVNAELYGVDAMGTEDRIATLNLLFSDWSEVVDGASPNAAQPIEINPDQIMPGTQGML